jgi:hypothetical protein
VAVAMPVALLIVAVDSKARLAPMAVRVPSAVIVCRLVACGRGAMAAAATSAAVAVPMAAVIVAQHPHEHKVHPDAEQRDDEHCAAIHHFLHRQAPPVW